MIWHPLRTCWNILPPPLSLAAPHPLAWFFSCAAERVIGPRSSHREDSREPTSLDWMCNAHSSPPLGLMKHKHIQVTMIVPAAADIFYMLLKANTYPCTPQFPPVLWLSDLLVHAQPGPGLIYVYDLRWNITALLSYLFHKQAKNVCQWLVFTNKLVNKVEV